jgi:cob(I)alamin adenosyltransferase
MDKSKLGLIHIYTGNGKGKTTASLGLILRASGRGLKVVLGQFLKGRETGELRTLSLLPGVTVFRGKPLTKFSFQMNEQEKAEVLRSHNAFIQELASYCRKEETDLLVLDEVIGACGTHLLDESLLIDFLKHKPEHLEVVMTGRNPSSELLKLADYVSEVCKRKHPFDKGIPAREGIEK